MKLINDDGVEFDIDSICVIGLMPDDVVAVKVHGQLNDKQLSRVSHDFSRFFPNNKVLVLPDEVEVEVVRAGDEKPK